MDAAMIVTWRRPVPGRESRALEYGIEAQRFWGAMAAEGRCSEPEMFFSPLGHGMWMVKGELDELQAIGASEEAQVLAAKGGMVLHEYTLEYVATGAGADTYIAHFAVAGRSLNLL